MDIRSLRQVLAIRQHGSFAKAARSLGISQPSLSKAIARLEDELGGQIFVRSAAGAALTQLGEVIAERATKVILEANGLERAAQLAAGGELGTLRIGIGTAMKRAFAPRLLQAIAARRPNLNLLIDTGDRQQLLPQLASRELDIVFCAFDPAIANSGQVVKLLFATFGVAVASPAHPLAAATSISPQRFTQFAHVGPRNAYFTVDALLGPSASDQLGPNYAANEFEVFLPLVLAGGATLLLPAFEAEPYVRRGELVVLDVAVDVAISYVGVTTSAAIASPLVKSVLQEAAAIGADLEAAQGLLQPPGSTIGAGAATP